MSSLTALLPTKQRGTHPPMEGPYDEMPASQPGTQKMSPWLWRPSFTVGHWYVFFQDVTC